MILRGLLGGMAACLLAAPALAEDLSRDTAVLQALDKSTARIRTLEAPVGQPVKFGSLEMVVRACRERPPEEQPESAAFIDIWETKPGEAAVSLFRGWMFASSPALSAMEHPVYDIWVLDCADEAELIARDKAEREKYERERAKAKKP